VQHRCGVDSSRDCRARVDGIVNSTPRYFSGGYMKLCSFFRAVLLLSPLCVEFSAAAEGLDDQRLRRLVAEAWRDPPTSMEASVYRELKRPGKSDRR
jgi:hypothetical protein